MKNIKDANSLYIAGLYREALSLYENISIRPNWESLVDANIKLCRRHIQRMVVKNEGYDGIIERPEIIISFTTIKSRLKYVPQVVESLLNQTLMPVRIDLNISTEPYLLDEGIQKNDPILLELIKNPLLQVNWVSNIGSYRKIWKIIEDHFSQNSKQDKIFVTVDDDTIYPDDFLEKLYNKYQLHDCVISFRGRFIELKQEEVLDYNQWSLGKSIPSLNNLPTGKDGILYNTKFFTRNFLDKSEILKIAPTADDLWIKWHLALNGVPSVILNPEASTSIEKSFPAVSNEESYRKLSLYSQHNSKKSQSKNDSSIRELEAYFHRIYGYNLAWLIGSEVGGLA